MLINMYVPVLIKNAICEYNEDVTCHQKNVDQCDEAATTFKCETLAYRSVQQGKVDVITLSLSCKP